MANSLYDAYKQEALGDAAGPGHGTVDWEGDNIKALLVDTADYTVNTATHADHDDVTGVPAAVVATSGNLANVSVGMSAGTATVDCDDWTWSTVTGDQAEAVIIYKDSGSTDTSLLVIYYDTFSSGMPVTPNGGDINVTVNASGLWTW